MLGIDFSGGYNMKHSEGQFHSFESNNNVPFSTPQRAEGH